MDLLDGLGDVDAWESALALGQSARQRAMHWILEVHPEMYALHDDCYCDDEFEECDELDEYMKGLGEQLALPETRFHAAYLFLLFAYKKGWNGWHVWDMALACVAVSAKVCTRQISTT